MKERKYIKFRVDMYDDTKFKIIDMKPERDLIHYVWNRIVVLAGKVNLEGELYLSRTIPYTIETLAIEFNRDINQIKLALEVLMELEMVELTKDKIYKVKNFAKHQNIKSKEKDKTLIEEKSIKDEENEIEKDFKEEINDVMGKEAEGKTIIKEKENAKNQGVEGIENENIISLKVINEDICKVSDNISSSNNHNNSSHANLEIRRNTVVNKKKKKNNSSDITEFIEENEGESIWDLSDGEYKLSQGEHILNQWAF